MPKLAWAVRFCAGMGMGCLLAAGAVAESTAPVGEAGGASPHASRATDLHLAYRPEAEAPEPPPRSEWYAPLKDIPLGPGTLSLDLNLRTRWEHYEDFTIRGYNFDEHDDVVMLRTQLGFDYRFSPDAHAYVMFQDARSWVSDLTRDRFPVTSPYFNQADVRKAYVEWKRIGGSPLGFKVGRQAFAYGDRKLLGPSNWGNVGGFWWDAAKVYVETDPVQVDLLFGQRVIREQIRWDNRHFDFDMMAAYARFKKLPFKLDALYILKYDDHGGIVGEEGTGDERRHTVGVHGKGKIARNWDWRGTLAAQFGRDGGDDVRAYAAHGLAGYTWLDAPWKPRVGGQVSFASGDRDPIDGRNETFDNLFTSPTKDYGRMNLVSWQNLVDYQATFGVQPTDKLTVWVDYHYFTLAAEEDAWYWFNMRPQRRDPTGGSGRELGHEIDLQAKWQVTPEFQVYCGYAYFAPGNFIRNTPGGDDDAHWGFVQLTYSF